MARDHTIKGDRYTECGVCAKTIRVSDAIPQRGVLVCADDVDVPQENEPSVTGGKRCGLDQVGATNNWSA